MIDPIQQALVVFLRESNAIEGIVRDPLPIEIEAVERLLRRFTITIIGLGDFQAICAPDMPLREHEGMNVRVGSHIAPPGGPEIRARLTKIVRQANARADPWQVHCQFEILHPYLDGNGRTGRALWLWQMAMLGRNPFQLPFLHRWYYQTLENSR